MTDVLTHPIQNRRRSELGRAQAPQAVTLRAYEVYVHLYGPQVALITGGCRGGFSSGELIMFLYASGFPRVEWRARVADAMEGLVL